jgi:hypothetical protein
LAFIESSERIGSDVLWLWTNRIGSEENFRNVLDVCNNQTTSCSMAFHVLISTIHISSISKISLMFTHCDTPIVFLSFDTVYNQQNPLTIKFKNGNLFQLFILYFFHILSLFFSLFSILLSTTQMSQSKWHVWMFDKILQKKKKKKVTCILHLRHDNFVHRIERRILLHSSVSSTTHKSTPFILFLFHLASNFKCLPTLSMSLCFEISLLTFDKLSVDLFLSQSWTTLQLLSTRNPIHTGHSLMMLFEQQRFGLSSIN